jgi:hypothetical protein
VIINELKPELGFSEKLCKLVKGENQILWESNWLREDIKSIINKTTIIDIGVLENIESVIDPIEINPFVY